jgi:hypothetical protein
MKLRILTSTLLIMLLSTFSTQSQAAPCWHRWGAGCCGVHHCAPVRYYACHDYCRHYSHPRHCGYWHCSDRATCCDKDKDNDKAVESKEGREHEGNCCAKSHCGHHFAYHRCWGDYYYRGGGY